MASTRSSPQAFFIGKFAASLNCPDYKPQPVGQDAVPEFVMEEWVKQYEYVSRQAAYSSNNGRQNIYDFKIQVSPAFALNSESLVAWLIKQNPNDHLNILDIGTSAGYPLHHLKLKFKDKVTLTGISGTDYYKMRFPRNFDYIVCDAHEMFKNGIKPNDYALIFSMCTFEYLADPIKVLMDAYQALKPGGLLIIDFLPIHGLSTENCFLLLNYLKEKGYKISAYAKDYVTSAGSSEKNPQLTISNWGGLFSIVIKKTKPKLDIPLTYLNKKDNKIFYQFSLPKDALKKLNPKQIIDETHRLGNKMIVFQLKTFGREFFQHDVEEIFYGREVSQKEKLLQQFSVEHFKFWIKESRDKKNNNLKLDIMILLSFRFLSFREVSLIVRTCKTFKKQFLENMTAAEAPQSTKSASPASSRKDYKLPF